MAAKIRVLIVDDHPLMRRGLACMINAEPDMAVVGEAETGADAVKLFHRHRPEVTLMDLMIPDTGGIPAIAEIRKRDPHARVVVLTGSSGTEDVYRALQAGARAYVLKGIAGPELLRVIRDVHGGRRVIPADVAELLAERMPQSDLSPRELDVLKLIVGGSSNKEIAASLGLSSGTIRTHVSNVLAKLGVTDRTQAATAALKRGIVRQS